MLALAAAAAALPACASDDEPEGRTGDIRQADTWNDVNLTGTVRILPGAVVDIAPGATIRCNEGVQILVGGTLRARAGADRAKITCASWLGILVAAEGVVDLEGVSIENARIGIETTPLAGESKLTDSAIVDAVYPFRVGERSSLVLTNVTANVRAKIPDGEYPISDVFGSLVARRLDYRAGPNEGISLKRDDRADAIGGEAVIEDSTIHGEKGLDMISTYAGKSLKMSYSKLSGAHCGAHIQGVESFELDHVTSESNTFGITIYGASQGVARNSNFSGDVMWLDVEGEHGPLTFENIWTKGGERIEAAAPPTINGRSEQPIAAAQPR